MHANRDCLRRDRAHLIPPTAARSARDERKSSGVRHTDWAEDGKKEKIIIAINSANVKQWSEQYASARCRCPVLRPGPEFLAFHLMNERSKHIECARVRGSPTPRLTRRPSMKS